ncbi:MAG TPA: EamA family transporter, partial [Candidatus Limnocylindrales bacterium]|nr:EamA family transporter [Candidatus Limnocylindrales bacterium]
PLLSAGVRHVVAAAIIFALLALTRGSGALRLTRAEWLGGGLVGLLLLLGGNGLVMLGERDVPSGLAALIVAVVPLWVVILRRIFGERIALGTIVGVVVGLSGVAVLIIPEGISGEVKLLGMLMIVGSSVSWAIGTYFSKLVTLPRDPLASTGAQMIVGGASLLVVGLLTGEQNAYRVEDFSGPSLLALAYLIVFGSVLAYTAYTWSLQHAPVSRVATYAYVNPVVAVTLGALLLNEPVHLTMLVGAAMIIVSVALVVRTESRPAAPTGALDAAPLTSRDVGEDEPTEVEAGEDPENGALSRPA